MNSNDHSTGGQQVDQNQSQLKMKKLQWQCRRGMLELDVILIPFLEKHFCALEQESQLLFEELLNQADPDLYTWIMGYGECEQQSLRPIIKTIREKMNVHS